MVTDPQPIEKVLDRLEVHKQQPNTVRRVRQVFGNSRTGFAAYLWDFLSSVRLFGSFRTLHGHVSPGGAR
jgi:hypothetical protein